MTFQIYENPHELVKESGHAKSDGNKTHSCFFLEKRKEDDVGKKQGKFP